MIEIFAILQSCFVTYVSLDLDPFRIRLNFAIDYHKMKRINNGEFGDYCEVCNKRQTMTKNQKRCTYNSFEPLSSAVGPLSNRLYMVLRRYFLCRTVVLRCRTVCILLLSDRCTCRTAVPSPKRHNHETQHPEACLK